MEIIYGSVMCVTYAVSPATFSQVSLTVFPCKNPIPTSETNKTISQFPMSNPTIRLKLLLDSNSGKVVFAEAGKDFVDFIFGLLQLPLGSILTLLVNHGLAGAGSISKIYRSVQNLDDDYLKTKQAKYSLLAPKMADSNTTQTPLLKQLAYKQQESSYYPYAYPSKDRVEGHVREAVVYMVTDDLEVKPLSTISTISLMNGMGVKNYGGLEEKIVDVDMDKGLRLLKASFESTTVLSDVFLPNMPFAAKRKRTNP